MDERDGGHDASDAQPELAGRRQLLEALGSAAVARVLLPAIWASPIVLLTPLPAHAACSAGFDKVSNDPPAGSVETSVPMKTSGSGATWALTIELPVASNPAGTQYRLYERQIVETSGQCTQVLRKAFVPTSNSATLASVSHTYSPHPTGGTRDLEFQLRWDSGDSGQPKHSPWLRVPRG